MPVRALYGTKLSPARMQFIDIGANLTHKSFDPDRPQAIERGIAAGVCKMIVTGSSAEYSAQAAGLAAEYPGILFSTAGIHPHHAAEISDGDRERLHALLQMDCTVAVGECGLDYCRNYSPKKAQRNVFSLQLELAAELGMPVFLHQRDAHSDFIAILREHFPGIPRAVAHCFTGSGDELSDCLGLGLYIGITGWICDERRGHHLKELVSEILPERLMIETDAPYLLPRDLRPKPSSRRNEPMYLPHIAETIAESLKIDIEELARQTTKNSEYFFSLPSSPSDA